MRTVLVCKLYRIKKAKISNLGIDKSPNGPVINDGIICLNSVYCYILT